MNTNSDVCFMRIQSVGSNGEPHPNEVDDVKNTTTEPTMANAVRPLLTSMKLFGLYFRCETEAGNSVTDKKPRRHWNCCMIYPLVVVVLMWINVARMFSAFTKILLIFCLLRTSSVVVFYETSLFLSCFTSRCLHCACISE